MSAYTAEWLFGYLVGSGVTALVMLRGRRFLGRRIKALQADLDAVKAQAARDAQAAVAELRRLRQLVTRNQP